MDFADGRANPFAFIWAALVLELASSTFKIYRAINGNIAVDESGTYISRVDLSFHVLVVDSGISVQNCGKRLRIHRNVRLTGDGLFQRFLDDL